MAKKTGEGIVVPVPVWVGQAVTKKGSLMSLCAAYLIIRTIRGILPSCLREEGGLE